MPDSPAAYPDAYTPEELKRIFENAVSPGDLERILALDPPLDPAGDERAATVWFSDIKGATALRERLGTEEQSRLIIACLEAITAEAIARGGYVDKYVGDEVLVLFGAPLSLSAEEQVLAAAELSFATVEIGRRLGLTIGVGFNIGQMRLACFSPRSRPSYTPFGDAVNLGARLEGEVKRTGARPAVVTHVRALIAARYRCVLVDDLKAKGFPEAKEIYAIVGERSGMPVEESSFWDRYDAAVSLVDGGRAAEAFPALTALRDEKPDDSLFETALERARRVYAVGLEEGFRAAADLPALASKLADSIALLFGTTEIGLLESGVDGLWRFRSDAPFASRGLLLAPEGEAMAWIRGLDRACLVAGAPEPLASSGFMALVPLRKNHSVTAVLLVGEAVAAELASLDSISAALDEPWAQRRAEELRERYQEKASDAEKLEEVNREIEAKSLALERALAEIRTLNAGLESKVAEAVARLDRASSLKRYLPPAVVDDIIEGRRDLAPRTERRRITVLFSDVRGFSEATDGLEPEELARLLDEYLSAMSDIAFAAGATIDKFRGDGMMVFFGAPEPIEPREGAIRCIRMAADMCRAVERLREKWFNEGYDWDLGVRFGINTGYATVGEFGSEERMDYTAVGTEVNLAARLEGCCETDSIVLSHSTWALVHDEIECRPLGTMELKGIHRPVRVYEADWKRNGAGA